MYPAAMVLTRGAYESALRVLWLLHPDDPFEREARYLALLEETEQLARLAARELRQIGADDESVQHPALVAEQIRGFREAVASKLPAGVVPPRRVPGMKDVIAESGFPARYLLYKFGCQYVHATKYATGLYRRHLGDAKEIGEFIEPKMWAEPLQLTWWSLQAPTERLLGILGADSTAFAASMPASKMKGLVTTLANEDPNPVA